MAYSDIPSIKHVERTLKEVQVFVGFTHSKEDGYLTIDLYRNMSAGNISCLYLIYPKVLTFSFNNRIVFVGIPPEQREEMYSSLFKSTYNLETRNVIINLHTRYTNPYSGEVVITGKEQYILDKDLLTIYESDVEKTKYYKPIGEETSDTESTLVTIRDIVKEEIPSPVDKSKIRAVAALDYLKDVTDYIYCEKEEEKHPSYFVVFPKVFHDPIDGKVMMGTHLPPSVDLYEGSPLWNVTMKTKDGIREHSMVFIDPYGALDLILQSKEVILRFRDATLYGADLNLADFDIEFYTA